MNARTAILAAVAVAMPVWSNGPPEPRPRPGLTFEAPSSGPYRFICRRAGSAYFLNPEGFEVRLRQRGRLHGVQVRLLGANPAATMEGERRLASTSSYFLGSDPRRWLTRVPHHGAVRARAVYPGIDMLYYGSEGELEFDFVVAPGADPGRIGWSVERAPGLHVDALGRLVARAGPETLLWKAPFAYQEHAGVRHRVACHYAIDADGVVRLRLGAYQRRRPLVIDPVLQFSSYLGGSSTDSGVAAAVDSSGFVYVAGDTLSPDLPASAGVQPMQPGGASDVFVMKLDIASSTIVYCTYLGGIGSDKTGGLAIDSSGRVHVTGTTNSIDFPMVNAVQAIPGGAADAFVTKLAADGASIVFSTFLGGSGDESGNAIAVGPGGIVAVAGSTASSNFPVLNAFQPAKAAGTDAFVVVYGATGTSIAWATCLGGAGDDSANAVAADVGGNIYVAGTTESSNFPMLNALQPTLRGAQDAFVVKFAPGGASLKYSTYVGGTGLETGRAMAVDSLAEVCLTGSTTSADFPTASAYQSTHGGGGTDAFVVKLNSLGSARIYSTYFGGSGDDSGQAIAVDPGGNVYVAGQTTSTNLPLANALDSTVGAADAFLAKFDPVGTTLMMSTYYGGSGTDLGRGVAVDIWGNAYVTGQTASSDLPLASPYQAALAGSSDAFLSATATFDAFVDVPSAMYYYSCIRMLRSRYITAGCTVTPPAFCPQSAISEGQMAIFVVRSIIGGDTFTYSSTPYFTDVPSSHPYFKWIQKMRDLAITSGCGGTLFCPDQKVTRSRMAGYLIRSRLGAGTAFSYPSTPYFTDVPSSHSEFAYIQKLKELGITGGCTTTTYCPASTVIRGDMAIFIMRTAFNSFMAAGYPVLQLAEPNLFSAGQTATVRVTGDGTHFVQGSTAVTVSAGITVGAVTVISSTALDVVLTVSASASAGMVSMSATTGSEQATLSNGLKIQ
jgi:hypothetical protein